MKKTKAPTAKAPEEKPLSRIDIGYAPLRVVHEVGMAECGSFDAARQTVGVFREQLPVDQLNSFLHELIHVIVQRYQIQVDDKLEEHLAQVFGNALTELIVKNPDFLAWCAARGEESRAFGE